MAHADVKLSVSCCSVIGFSCPTCSSEGKSLFPPPLQLLLIWKDLSHDLETRPTFHPSHCFSLPVPSCSTFSTKCFAYSWIACSKKGILLPHEEGPRHVSHRLHSCSYSPKQRLFFFGNRMLLNHVQLVTAYNPKGITLYNCCPSSLSCPSTYLFSWSLLLLKCTNKHLPNPLLDLLNPILTLSNISN